MIHRKISIFLVIPILILFLDCSSKKSGIDKSQFGKTPGGQSVYSYQINNSKGLSAELIEYGAALVTLKVPDNNGKVEDILLGYDNLQDYIDDESYFGVTVGRYANRIGDAEFTLDGKKYKLTANDNGNQLHGGQKGLSKVNWKSDSFEDDTSLGVHFSYLSPDGEEGYPGNLSIDVTYRFLKDRNEMRIEYSTTTDKSTPVNLSNHSYFNLTGPGKTSILDHHLKINSETWTPTDNELIPTGEIKSVIGTPLDFTEYKKIGSDMDQLPDIEMLKGGYDFNWILDKESQMDLAASVYDPESGRNMKIFTTEPALQFYSGNFLDGTINGKYGVKYKQYHAFVLETQHYPDSPNHDNFPSTILRPGQEYRQLSIYKFTTRSKPGDN